MTGFRMTWGALAGCAAATLLTAGAASAQGFVTGPGKNLEPSRELSAIYRRDTAIDNSGNYRSEVQACLSGQAQQPRETCLEEARNALAEARRNSLSHGQENYTANALARCHPLSGEEKAACEARVMGFGNASGSVGGGGLLRWVETVVVPSGAGTVRIIPKTAEPVVLVPVGGGGSAAAAVTGGAVSRAQPVEAGRPISR